MMAFDVFGAIKMTPKHSDRMGGYKILLLTDKGSESAT